MNINRWLQLALYVLALSVITKPMGLYLMQVLDANGGTWLDPVLRPLERFTYRLMGVQSDREQIQLPLSFRSAGRRPGRAGRPHYPLVPFARARQMPSVFIWIKRVEPFRKKSARELTKFRAPVGLLSSWRKAAKCSASSI